MKNKISTICIIGMLLLINIIGITGLSVAEEGAGTSKKINGDMVGNKKNIEVFSLKNNKAVNLGSATIVGDGTKDGSSVDAEVRNDLYIPTNSETSYVDLYISYSMICDGLTDSGLIILTIQINGVNEGSNEVVTIDNDEGKLKVENVQVEWTDIFTYEISVAYTNLVPPFVKPIIVFGGGVIGPESKDEEKCKSFIFSEMRQMHLIQSFQGNEIDQYNCKAREDRESGWLNLLSAAMLKNKLINRSFLRFLENHPHLSL